MRLVWHRPPDPISTPPPPRLPRLADILAGWRAAERALAEVTDRPAEAARLEADVAAWKATYQRTYARLREKELVRPEVFGAWRVAAVDRR